jgi:transposase
LLKAKKKAEFSFLPPRQRSSSHCGFNETLLKLKWDVLPHPPYSPDLAPSDYHLFGAMKRVLGGKRFRNNEEVIVAMQSWIHKQPKTFLETGIKKLPERWHKCMAVNREYIEK